MNDLHLNDMFVEYNPNTSASAAQLTVNEESTVYRLLEFNPQQFFQKQFVFHDIVKILQRLNKT